MSSPSPAPGARRRLDGTADVARAMAEEWRDDRVTGLAAEVAFFAMLAFFPGLLATAGALGFLDGLFGEDVAQQASSEVIGFLSQILTDEADPTVAAVEDLFTERSPGVFTLGIVAALWAASRGFMAVIRALDVAYDLEECRGYLQMRATALALALGTVVVSAVTLAMLVLGPFLGTGQEVAEAIGLGEMFTLFWRWLRWPVTVAVLIGWAAVVFHVAPFRHTPWRWNLPGALATAFLWVLISLGMRLYLAVAAGGNAVLGTLGGALILVLWLYLLAVGLLIGGELNAILAGRHGVATEPRARWRLEPGDVMRRLRTR